MKQAPVFPPLLKGHRIDAKKSPVKRAKAMAAKGEFGAGDLVWTDDVHNLRFAIVLEPQVTRARCNEMLFLMMVAFGDALGALAPPEMAVTYKWPCDIQLNDASIGECNLAVSVDESGTTPDWMVLSLDIAMKPEKIMHDPGEEAWRTTMWDEGCGEISRTELLESTSRHFLAWVHTWDEEGFKPVHGQWMGRLCKNGKLVEGVSDNEFIGIDETGNALLKSGEEMESMDTTAALDKIASVKGMVK